MRNILDNKILRGIGKTIYVLLYIIVLLVLLVVVIQRFSGNNATIGGFRIFNVATGSMIPVYNVGDIIVSKEISPEGIQVGDDIVYKGEKNEFNGKVVTHRVISKREENGKYYFVTQGVANELPDPEISEEQVYGKIIYKTIILSFISKIINNIYAFYFLIFVPIAIIICKIIVDNVMSYKEGKKEIAEAKGKDEDEKKEDDESDKDNEEDEELEEKEDKNEEEKVEDSKEGKNKKKNKSILKYINTKTIIILIVLLSFNAYAWFIYITKASLELDVHVAAWDITFQAGEEEITNDVVLEVDKIYPGMEGYVQEIEVHNRGEISADLSYKIMSIEIFGEKFEVGDQYTSDDLQNMLNSYPFKITIESSTDQIDAGTGQGKFTIKVTWPFESGNDELDTYYGNKSYEFQTNNPQAKSLIVKFELTAKQSA